VIKMKPPRGIAPEAFFMFLGVNEKATSQF